MNVDWIKVEAKQIIDEVSIVVTDTTLNEVIFKADCTPEEWKYICDSISAVNTDKDTK